MASLTKSVLGLYFMTFLLIFLTGAQFPTGDYLFCLVSLILVRFFP